MNQVSSENTERYRWTKVEKQRENFESGQIQINRPTNKNLPYRRTEVRITVNFSSDHARKNSRWNNNMFKEKKQNKIPDSKYITNEIILPKWRRNKFSQNITEGINCQWICPVRNVRSSSSMRRIVIEVSNSHLHKAIVWGKE